MSRRCEGCVGHYTHAGPPARVQAMTQAERDWVDAYHAEVWDKVSPRVSGVALEWLRANTALLQSAQPAPELVAA